MTQEMMEAMVTGGGYVALSLGGVGSSIGCGVAAMAACGAWKKLYMQNKPAPFQLIFFCGMPLSQTIYGVVLFMMIHQRATPCARFWPVFLFLGLFAGIALLVSALYQGKGAASACDAFAETGKGFTNYLLVLGIIETVALFALAFAILALPSPDRAMAMAEAAQAAAATVM